MNPDQLADGLLWLLVFLFSTTCHEAAHALVAKWGGDPTAYLGGQVSLNPLPHIQREPIGMLAVPIVGFALTGFMFGWASAPFDPIWAARHPRRSGWMALAGPLANLSIALAAVLVFRGVLAFHLLPADEFLSQAIVRFFQILILLNLVLFAFNMFPLAPLDGGRAAVLLAPEHYAQSILAKTHAAGPFGLFIAWVVMSKLMDVVDLGALFILLVT